MIRKQKERVPVKELFNNLIDYFKGYRLAVNMDYETWRDRPELSYRVYSFISRFLSNLVKVLSSTEFILYDYGYRHVGEERVSNIVVNKLYQLLNQILSYNSPEEIIARPFYLYVNDAEERVREWLEEAQRIIAGATQVEEEPALTEDEEKPVPQEEKRLLRKQDAFIRQIEEVARAFNENENLREKWGNLRNKLINSLRVFRIPAPNPQDISRYPQGVEIRYLGRKYIIADKGILEGAAPLFLADTNLSLVSLNQLVSIYKENWAPHSQRWRDIKEEIERIARHDNPQELEEILNNEELRNWWEQIIRPYFIRQIAAFLRETDPEMEELLRREHSLNWHNVISVFYFEKSKLFRWRLSGQWALGRQIQKLEELEEELKALTSGGRTITSQEVYEKVKDIIIKIEGIITFIHGGADYLIDCLVPAKPAYVIEYPEEDLKNITISDLRPTAPKHEEEEFYDEETLRCVVAIDDWENYLKLVEVWVHRKGISNTWLQEFYAFLSEKQQVRPKRIARELLRKALRRLIRRWGARPISSMPF